MNIPLEVLPILQNLSVENELVQMPRMERVLYVKVNKCLTALGGKWDRRRMGHVFDGDPGDRINDAVTTGHITDLKKEFQFYRTPSDLADRMVRIADVKPGDAVLEPSAGDGAILDALYRMIDPSRFVDAFELDERHQKALAVYEPEATIYWGDFLTSRGVRSYDKIIANPPFRNGQDVDHVKRMFDVLKPGGRIVAVMSPGWTFRTDRRHSEFREWIEDEVEAEWETLEPGTFRESGTMVNTVLVTIDKVRVPRTRSHPTETLLQTV